MKSKYFGLFKREIGALNLEASAKAAKDPIQMQYYKWLLDNEVVIKGLKFPACFGEQGILGITCVEDLPPDTVLATIPGKMILSLDYVRESKMKEIYKLYHGKEPDSMCFSIFLYHQWVQGKGFWLPYVRRAIAVDFEMAYEWSDELLKQLQDPVLMNSIIAYGKSVNLKWEWLRGIFAKYVDRFPPKKLNRTEFMKLFKYITTHGFNGGLPCPMILPFAECLNHSNEGVLHLDVALKGKETESLEYGSLEHKDPVEILKTRQIWHARQPEDSDEEEKEEEENSSSDEEDSFETKINPNYPFWEPRSPDILCFLKTGPNKFAKDSHLAYSYGKRSNSDLLESFGFILLPNKYDTYTFSLWNNLNPKESLKTLINKAIVPNSTACKINCNYKEFLFNVEDPKFKDLEVSACEVALKWDHLPSRSLMRYIRKQQIPHYKGEDSDKLLVSGPLIEDFEIECLEFAIEILKKKLVVYPTTSEQDIALLAEAKGQLRLSECIHYRIGQKKLLEFNIEAYGLLISILKNIKISGIDFKSGYMKPCEPYEKTPEEVIANRMCFREYLRQLALTRKLWRDIPFEPPPLEEEKTASS